MMKLNFAATLQYRFQLNPITERRFEDVAVKDTKRNMTTQLSAFLIQKEELEMLRTRQISSMLYSYSRIYKIMYAIIFSKNQAVFVRKPVGYGTVIKVDLHSGVECKTTTQVYRNNTTAIFIVLFDQLHKIER